MADSGDRDKDGKAGAGYDPLSDTHIEMSQPAVFGDMAEMVIRGMDDEWVHSVIAAVNDDRELEPADRDHALVFNGVALGVDQSQKFMLRLFQQDVEMLRGLANIIDEQMSGAPLELIESLGKVMKPVTEHLNARLDGAGQATTKMFEQIYHIPSEWIESSEDLDDLERHPQNIMIGIAMHAWRHHPGVIMGWYAVQSENAAGAGIAVDCTCPACYQKLWRERGRAPEDEVMQRMVQTYGSFDVALRKFSSYLVTEARKARDTAREGIAQPMHSVDAVEAKKSVEDLLQRVLGRTP